MRVPVAVVTGAVTVCRASGPGDRVVADSLDAEQAPVGGVADLPQRRQIRRSFPDPEIVGVGDGGLGARGLPVLLDRGVFVVHVQARGDPGGDHPGPGTVPVSREAAADRTGVEDETDLIGAADVEVVADDLLEEDPTRDRCVEHLGQGELGLQDRQVVAVASGPIGRGERMRGVGLPFAVDRAEGDSTQIEKSLTREIRSAIAWPISTCAESTRMPMSDSSS